MFQEFGIHALSTTYIFELIFQQISFTLTTELQNHFFNCTINDDHLVGETSSYYNKYVVKITALYLIHL